MNAKQLIAAVAVFAAAGSTFAGSNTEYVDQSSFQSTKTRAEVRAELEKAYAAGELNQQSEYAAPPVLASSKTRDQVRGEAIQAAKVQYNSQGSQKDLYFGD
jgi:phosphate-selective porin